MSSRGALPGVGMAEDRQRESSAQEPAETHLRAGTGRFGLVSTGLILMGEQGLRAGWGCLLFLGLLALLEWLAGLLAKQLHAPDLARGSSVPPGYMIVGELVSVALVLLLTLGMARLERRRFGGFGLGDRAFLPRVAGGLVCGFTAISALVGGLWARHLLVLEGPQLHGGAAWQYGLEWGLGFLLVALFEETLLRGYLLFTLARGVGFWWSAVLLSLGFGLIHGNNAGETPVGLFSAGAVGLLFCLSVWYTGSLWWAIGFHAAWDWGESFFWGTSDSGMVVKGHLLGERPTGAALMSGGATGPEGSLLVFAVLLVCAVLMWLWWRGQEAAIVT